MCPTNRVLSVPANRTALEVMLDQDPTTAYSCQQGFCGTCKVKVLAGQVDHRGRTAVGDNGMVVCMSRAKGDRVVIDA
jgi:ferredoxin